MIWSTGKGILYQKLRWYNPIKQKSKIILECSVCSMDEELWPFGSITSTSHRLESGVTPCNCNKNTRWESWQYEILARRLCKSLGYEYKGLAENYKGSKTKIKIFNKVTGNTWSTFDYHRLLSGREDPALRKAKSAKRKIKRLQQIHPDYTIISCGKYPYIICDKCSYDEYVKLKVCTGVFKSSWNTLSKGSKPCRCSGSFRWNHSQLEKLVKIRSEKVEVVSSISPAYKGKRTEVYWYCPCGCRNKVSFEVFMNNLHCNSCHPKGYNPNILGRGYLVMWYGFCESFLKVGITNQEVSHRVKRQYFKGSLDYKILKTFQNSDGYRVQEWEKEIKTMFSMGVCPKSWLPDGYTETLEDSEGNRTLIVNSMKDYL